MRRAWTHPVWVAAATAVVVALVAGLAAFAAFRSGAADEAQGPEGTENGTGVRYRGAFYWLSSIEVRRSALGPAAQVTVVPFQDTAIRVRPLIGVDPDVAVAGYTRTYPGTGSTREYGWLLLARDLDLAADPWTEPTLARHLLPPPR